ncbi:Transcription factor [Vanrija pseudolonga]|uniref:Transcription factor n=1 Tax=Vanrija pseudolonga TaxID=143232 RepID=A0AAF1BSY6_9TREE|nr:Transcription factor [Vanrija pseudolonga]
MQQHIQHPTPPEAYASTSAQPSKGLEPQTLLVLVGLPGSGKSTLANALVAASESAAWPPTARRWVRASQDDAPSKRRQEVEGLVARALADGHNVVVDRVDFDAEQRAHFVNIGHAATPRPRIFALTLTVSQATLRGRLSQRTGHPTIPDAEQGLAVLDKMQRAYSPPRPTGGEGFDRLYTLDEVQQPLPGTAWTPERLLDILSRVERGAVERGAAGGDGGRDRGAYAGGYVYGRYGPGGYAGGAYGFTGAKRDGYGYPPRRDDGGGRGAQHNGVKREYAQPYGQRYGREQHLSPPGHPPPGWAGPGVPGWGGVNGAPGAGGGEHAVPPHIVFSAPPRRNGAGAQPRQ